MRGRGEEGRKGARGREREMFSLHQNQNKLSSDHICTHHLLCQMGTVLLVVVPTKQQIHIITDNHTWIRLF